MTFVPELDHDAGARASLRQLSLTKPPGSLGLLEDVAVQLARLQGSEQPLTRPAAVLLFAADHPVTRHGISPYPSAVTRAMVDNFLRGGACASVLARGLTLPLHVTDVGVDGEAEASPLSNVGRFVRDEVANAPSGDILFEDALDEATFLRARSAGRRALERAGSDLKIVLLGEMGIGNTTVAAAVAGSLLGLSDPGEIVGRGTGANDEMLERKREIVRRAVERIGAGNPPREVLRRLGGKELAALHGAFEAAIENRAAVLVDGFIVSTVALALVLEEPKALDYLFFSHRSAEQGHRKILEALGARTLLDLDLRLGEASGALLAFPLIEQAAELHRSMATFQEASVPDRER